eukprot:Rmarinus@m.19147
MATDVLSGFYECSECRKIRSCYWFSKSQFQLPSGGRCKKCIEEQVEKEKASGQQKRAKIAATRLRRDMKKKSKKHLGVKGHVVVNMTQQHVVSATQPMADNTLQEESNDPLNIQSETTEEITVRALDNRSLARVLEKSKSRVKYRLQEQRRFYCSGCQTPKVSTTVVLCTKPIRTAQATDGSPQYLCNTCSKKK